MAEKKIKGMGFLTGKPIRPNGPGITGNRVDNMSYINSPAIGPGSPGKSGGRQKKQRGGGRGKMNGSVDMTKF